MVGANTATWSDDSVCNGQSYSYRGRAYSTAIPYETPYSNVVQVMPTVPTPPVLTITQGSEVRLNISWTDPTTDETGYRVEKCLGSGCTEFYQIASLTGTTYSDSGLIPGYTYSYRVKGYKTATCPWETVGAATAGTPTITAPAALAATVVNTTRIDLSWTDNSASETGFRIERCSGANCTNYSQVATSTLPSWSDTTVSNGTSYSYRVRATRTFHTYGIPGYSNTASATTQAARHLPTSVHCRFPIPRSISPGPIRHLMKPATASSGAVVKTA